MLSKHISSLKSSVYYAAKDINVRGLITRDRSQSDVKRMTAQETRFMYYIIIITMGTRIILKKTIILNT